VKARLEGRARTAQDAPRRRIYDALPRYVQSTLSLHDRDGALRGGPLAPRIAQALQWKEQGNELFRAKDAEGAASLYSRAAGLFVFVAPRVPDWRTQGVLDSSVGVVSTLSLAQSDVGPEAHGLPPAHTFFAPEEAPARELLGSLYSNLAAALLAQREWGEAVRAAGDALRCNPRNAKALFRRALARARSPASGSVELEMAVADLEAACALEPTNGEYSREWSARAAELARADRAHRAALPAQAYINSECCFRW
jgi:tetratricopeptide (TPR) repeat protein